MYRYGDIKKGNENEIAISGANALLLIKKNRGGNENEIAAKPVYRL